MVHTFSGIGLVTEISRLILTQLQPSSCDQISFEMRKIPATEPIQVILWGYAETSKQVDMNTYVISIRPYILALGGDSGSFLVAQ